MDANQGGVEHEVLVLAVGCQHLKDALPHTGFGPTREAGVDALPFAVSLGQVMPVRTGAQNPQNTMDEQAVISAVAAWITGLARQ